MTSQAGWAIKFLKCLLVSLVQNHSKLSFWIKDDQPVKPRMLTVKSTTPLSQNSRCSDPTSMIWTKRVSNRPLRRPPAASIQALAALLCTFNKESIFNDASLSCIVRKGFKFALFAEIFRTFTGWYLFTAGIESSRLNQMFDWEWKYWRYPANHF